MIVASEPLRLATTAMGTRFELALFGEDTATLRAAGEAALHEVEYWHARLSRFAKDSLVSHINRTAARTPVRLDSVTFSLFACAQQVMRLSDNAFDITLGRGHQSILLDRATRSIAFTESDVSIDLGSIGKGFAVDRAAEILRENRVCSALLHGGTSSVIAIGAPPDAAAWHIALGSVDGADVVALRDAALSVSAPHGRVTDGQGHIIDPRTGEPVQQGQCAAIAGPSATLADAWSTAMIVLGERPAALGEEWQTWLYRVALS